MTLTKCFSSTRGLGKRQTESGEKSESTTTSNKIRKKKRKKKKEKRKEWTKNEKKKEEESLILYWSNCVDGHKIKQNGSNGGNSFTVLSW
jgi:hypothetical protein